MLKPFSPDVAESQEPDRISITIEVTPEQKRRLERLAGSVEGPSDLPTNPKHTEGYGR